MLVGKKSNNDTFWNESESCFCLLHNLNMSALIKDRKHTGQGWDFSLTGCKFVNYAFTTAQALHKVLCINFATRTENEMPSWPKINTLEFLPQYHSLPPRVRACVCVCDCISLSRRPKDVSQMCRVSFRRSVTDVNIVTFKQKEDIMWN